MVRQADVSYGCRTSILTTGLVLLILASVCDSQASAGDWPQILGPNRDGVVVGEKLLEKFPAGGPEELWRFPVGDGLAGVAVADDLVILFHREGNQDLCEGLDATTGKSRWKAGFPTRYVSGISEDQGPRCVPVLHQGVAYLYGAAGGLHAVEIKSGKKLWSRPINKEFNAPEGYFGAGSTPLVEGDKLIVNIGSREGAGIVAFALKDGATVWKSTSELASYSAPVAVTHEGVRHLIVVTRLNTVSLDPATGAVRWKLRFGQTGPTVNGASPIVSGNHLFLTASYGIGAVLAEFTATEVKTVWTNDDTLSSQYPTPVLAGTVLYGIDGRQDVGQASLRCVELLTGKVLWSQDGFGMATLIRADDKLLMLKTDGTLVLAKATVEGYQELGSASVFDTTARALPALSNGRLFARDTKVLKCLKVGR